MADRHVRLCGTNRRTRNIFRVNPLHRARAVARNDDRALRHDPVPEERLAIERVVQPVYERRPQRGHGDPLTNVQREERPLALGLVAVVLVRVLGAHERIALVVVEALAIHCDARHEDVAP